MHHPCGNDRERGGAVKPRERCLVRGSKYLPPLALCVLLNFAGANLLQPQSALGRSANIRGDWELAAWQSAFVFNHRFEFVRGGDELINLPTLSLAIGLAGPFAVGVDYTSNSEIVADKLGINEAQLWLGVSGLVAGPVRFGAIIAGNSAARSTDGAVTGALRLGPLSLLGEARGYSDIFRQGEGGFGLAGGVIWHLTPRLELSGDIGRLLRPDSVRRVWSAGAAVAIPGSPHTLSLHATNSGPVTLQGVSRPGVLARRATRYGFTFTVPLGSRAQWARIFQRDPPEPLAPEDEDVAVRRVDIRLIAYTPREIRIRVGETVEWMNRDPLQHTVTADDKSWDSGLLDDGQRYRRTFEQAGRYTYHCTPHPQMTGVVIVEDGGTGG